MFNWKTAALDVLSRTDRVCLVRIENASGSTPRNQGTVMVVSDTGVFGSIGGGHLEHEAIRLARANLQDQNATNMRKTFILGPDVEQCCGGQVGLQFYKVRKTEALPNWDIPKIWPVYIFGAGHVGQALARVLASQRVCVHQFDSRPDYTNASVQRFECPADITTNAEKDSIYYVMTHDHDLDYHIVANILKAGHFAFLGLIGSKTKRARFFSRLRKDGFNACDLSRVTCPIGIERIRGKEPEVIALSAAAQLLQVLEEKEYGD